MATDSRYFAQKAIDAADALWDEGLMKKLLSNGSMSI